MDRDNKRIDRKMDRKASVCTPTNIYTCRYFLALCAEGTWEQCNSVVENTYIPDLGF